MFQDLCNWLLHLEEEELEQPLVQHRRPMCIRIDISQHRMKITTLSTIKKRSVVYIDILCILGISSFFVKSFTLIFQIYYYQDQNTFIPASNRRLVVLQYLDLDLEATESFTSSSLPPTQSPPNTTVYKTVDFLKTEAFNRTRQRVEEERKQCTDELA